jgi:hypothetical protein
MLQRCLVFILAAALGAVPVGAGDHLVSQNAVDARMAAAARERAQNVATIDQVLSSARAAKTARSAGVDLAKVRGAVPSLSDQELRDLATRAASLRSDVVAGQYVIVDDDRGDGNALLMFMILVGVAAAVVILVDHYY